MSALIQGGHTGCSSGQRHEAIERAAVEQVPAHVPRHCATDGALAGATRAVDGDDRHANSVAQSVSRPNPAWRAHASNPGKLVATLATSAISIGARARRAATAKAMAMR